MVRGGARRRGGPHAEPRVPASGGAEGRGRRAEPARGRLGRAAEPRAGAVAAKEANELFILDNEYFRQLWNFQ